MERWTSASRYESWPLGGVGRGRFVVVFSKNLAHFLFNDFLKGIASDRYFPT